MTGRRYEPIDFKWLIIEPLLPNKPRGVARVDDRKVPNGIYRRLGPTFPTAYGPSCYNRFVRWGRIGVRDHIFDAVSAAYDGSEQSVGSSLIRVHWHGANARRGCAKRRNHRSG